MRTPSQHFAALDSLIAEQAPDRPDRKLKTGPHGPNSRPRVEPHGSHKAQRLELVALAMREAGAIYRAERHRLAALKRWHGDKALRELELRIRAGERG